MSLGNYFVCPKALERYRQGVLSTNLDGFADWLEESKFVVSSIRRHLNFVSQWLQYLMEKGVVKINELKDEHITDFLAVHRRGCSCQQDTAFCTKVSAQSVHRFVEYLVKNGLWSPGKNEENPYEEIQGEYLIWLRDFRNDSEGTCNLRRQYLEVFLKDVAVVDGLETLSGEKVEQFFLNYAQDHKVAARRSMQGTLRTFFNFCQAREYHSQNLSFAVPTLRTYRLSKVPRGIEAEDAIRVIAETKMDSAAGIRDHAILQILCTYGVRGGQVRALKLEDINWTQNEIRFASMKKGKEILQPLTDEVGETLLTYLEKARPRTGHQEVFLTTRAPYQPLCRTALSEIARCRIKASGIEAPSKGAHVFRHTFATRMLAQGEHLKTIADMLGHRHLTTTYQYTKVDLRGLRQVALEWPEVNP